MFLWPSYTFAEGVAVRVCRNTPPTNVSAQDRGSSRSEPSRAGCQSTEWRCSTGLRRGDWRVRSEAFCQGRVSGSQGVQVMFGDTVGCSSDMDRKHEVVFIGAVTADPQSMAELMGRDRFHIVANAFAGSK